MGRVDRPIELALLWIWLAACEEVRVTPVPASVPAPANADRGELCADVAEVRACWGPGLGGASCANETCLVPRPLPESHASAAGWLCSGTKADRTCTPRSRHEASWQCDGAVCVQRYPRLPDQGEWDCSDLDGVVRCVGGHPAAGVPPASPEPGWVCGSRSGAEGAARICVDFTPDVPDRRNRDRWRCKFLRREGLARSCERAPPAPRLGSVCADASACPAGAYCAGGKCLPPWPKPSCYLDDDCGPGRACRFGSCAGGA